MSDLRVRAAVERFRREVRREALEEAARIADRGMLYGTDGGSPTEDETAVAESIAAAIRALMEPGDG
jgi:hypothetical protein